MLHMKKFWLILLQTIITLTLYLIFLLTCHSCTVRHAPHIFTCTHFYGYSFTIKTGIFVRRVNELIHNFLNWKGNIPKMIKSKEQKQPITRLCMHEIRRKGKRFSLQTHIAILPIQSCFYRCGLLLFVAITYHVLFYSYGFSRFHFLCTQVPE